MGVPHNGIGDDMSVGILSGNVKSITIMQATVDLGSVAANTSEEETATLTGVRAGDVVKVVKSDLDAGIILGTVRVTADDTIAIQVSNTTAGAVNAASETMTFEVSRPESTDNLPTEVLS